jgi:hypothetical protein
MLVEFLFFAQTQQLKLMPPIKLIKETDTLGQETLTQYLQEIWETQLQQLLTSGRTLLR